jgi:hypothetical protein
MIASRMLEPGMNDLKTKFNLKPTMFFDLKFSRESQSEKSKENRSEADFICKLL